MCAVMAENIVDANGWPSEPDTVNNKRKLFRRNKKHENNLAKKAERSREPPEEEDDKVLNVSDDMNERDLPESNDDGISLVQRVELIRRQLAVRDAREAFSEALDAAIAAEKELGKQLYAIENTKKNTLTAADYVYGDDANFKAIIESANAAKMKAVEMPNALVDIAGDKASQLASVASQAMIGRGLILLLDSGQGFDFAADEKDKIDELRSLIEENKQSDAEFSAETPYDVDSEDYQAAMQEYGTVPEIDDASDELSM